MLEGGGTVHRRHHHVKQNGVRNLARRGLNPIRARVCKDDLPARHRFQTEPSYLADVFFIINNQYATSH